MPKNNEEKSVFLKLEAVVPTTSGAPRRFCVNRKMKVRWSSDPEAVCSGLFDEINGYRGSFVGDMVHSLDRIVKNDEIVSSENSIRKLDVDKWTATLLEKMLFDAYAEGSYEEMLDVAVVSAPDGDIKEISQVTGTELNDIDTDRVMHLMGPKIQHLCYLMSKKIKRAEKDDK